MEKNSASVTELALSIRELAITVKSIETQFLAKNNTIEAKLGEHREEIEMLRTRTHSLFNHLTVLRLMAERNGWKFSSKDWEIEGINR